MADLVVRAYGAGPEIVIAVHGGPAAAGDVAPLARTLGERWHVLEPFQRGSGSRPLTVATHVQDLDDLIRERCDGKRPVIVGHSWGAMLALAYAARHPQTAAGVALIGCGTFSELARAEFRRRLEERLAPQDRAAVAFIERSEANPDRRLAALGCLMTRVHGYDSDELEEVPATLDAIAHEQTWGDMMHRQQDGTYPEAFSAITVPVLMLHGSEDPHPGTLTQDDLRSRIPHLEYLELPKCGHYPWLERQARSGFHDALMTWIAARFSSLDEM